MESSSNLLNKDEKDLTEVDGRMHRQISIYEAKFDEIRILGRGSFSLVLMVKDKTSSELFALKKIPIKIENIKQVSKEFKFLDQLRSEFVVKYFGSWHESNYHLSQNNTDVADGSSLSSDTSILYNPNTETLLNIQMELCLFTLREAMEKLIIELKQKSKKMWGPIGYLIACELFIEILECVEYLHSQNPSIIHRDLKPSNMLISSGTNGRFIKLSDFGLSTVHKFDEESHTQATGTYKYMAPEVHSSKHYDTKADIYSLGIIIQELFHIDINRSNSLENAESALTKKYPEIFNLMNRMMAIKKKSRPDCKDVLQDRNLWSLGVEDIINDSNLKDILDKPSTIEESFHKYFLQKKIKLF